MKHCSILKIRTSVLFFGQNWQRFLVDGLHLSEDGSRFLAKHLLKMVTSRTSHLPEQLPDWKDIDLANPEKSLLA